MDEIQKNFKEHFDKVEAHKELEQRVVGNIRADYCESSIKSCSSNATSKAWYSHRGFRGGIAIVCCMLIVLIPVLAILLPLSTYRDVVDIRNYGNAIGVLATHTMTRNDLIYLIDPLEPDNNWDEDDRLFTGESGSDSAPQSPGDGGDSDHTTTNVQVDGVLEGDIIQVDSNYIYILSRMGLTIVCVRNQMRIVYRQEFQNFSPDEMFIFGNLLVVIGGEVVNNAGGDSWWNTRLSARIMLFDVTNRNNAARLHEFSVSGQFITSRLIDNRLIVTTNHNINRRRENTFFPKINGEELPIRYVHMHGTKDFTSHLVLASLNLETLDLSVASHMGLRVGTWNSTQYFSRYNVYFFTGAQEFCERGDSTAYTYVTRISFLTLMAEANTTILGHVNNRFWVSEYNNNIRIVSQAFTSGRGNLGRHTNLYILNSGLGVINSVSHISQGRTIHGVRFRGNQVALDTYIMIHIRIDSVYIIDLTNTQNIVITQGEPEYGTNEYLQFLSDNVVIGLGHNTTTQNNFTSFQGVKVSLYNNVGGNFNVVDSHTLGTNQAFTEAMGNPRGIVNDTARNMFSFPITMSLPSDNSFNPSRPRIEGQGLAVFEYDLTQGNESLVFRGLLSNLPQNHTFRSWEDMNYHSFSFVKRGARIGDRIFTISYRHITSYCATTLNLVQRLRLDFNTCRMMGHNWVETSRRNPTCTRAGHVSVRCRRCGRTHTQVLSRWSGHNFGEWAVTTLPSGSNPGRETRTCLSGCGTTERRNLVNHSYANGLLLRRNIETNEYYIRTFTRNGVAVNIPNYHNNVPITKIEPSAFADAHITSITLPNHLRVIGASAFINNLDITQIVIPASVEYIGANAFGNNRWRHYHFMGNIRSLVSNLSTITFEGTSSLRTIGSSAFENTSLSSIVIPRSVEVIGAGAFSTRSNAERGSIFVSIEFESGSNLTTIGSGAFTGTRISSIVFPSRLENVPSSLFANVSTLTSVEFEGGGQYNEYIGWNAFTNTSIANIQIPVNIERIYGNAFRSIPTLTTVHIPASATSIAYGAFALNPALVNLTMDSGEGYRFVGNTVIRNSDNAAIFGTRYSIIPPCVSNIAEEAFMGMGLSGKIVVASSVANIGGSAFANNPNITNIIIESGSNLETIGSNAFAGNSNLLSINLENANSLISIGNRAFHNTRNIATLNIPSSVWMVSPWTFEGWISSQTINVLGATDTLDATIRLGVNWMAGSSANVNYIP